MKGNAYIPFMRSRGDGSTLNLDFTGGSLDSRVVLTRSANTATYINSSGYVTTAVANEARFEYDPTTLAAKGLLIEGEATNIFNQSVGLSASPWFTGSNVTRTLSTGGNGPDGSNNTASKLSCSSINSGSSLYYNGVSLTSGTTYTMSVFAKADGANFIWIYLERPTGIVNGAFFDLSSNGALGNTTGTIVSGSNTITKYPNGWFRITFSHIAAATTTHYPVVLPATTNGTGYASILGQSPNGVLVYGAQLELGTTASSYIPTTTAQVTRNPDLALMTSTNFSSWFTGGTTGTFFVDFHGGVRGITSTVRSVISTNDQTTKHLHLQQVSAAGALKVADFGAANSVSTANTITSGARTKGAFNFDGATTTVNLCLNGGTVATSTAIAFSVAPTWLVLGATSTTGTSLTDLTTVLNGSIRQIKYYPTALTSAQLIAMST
jgi:hypothetical protein